MLEGYWLKGRPVKMGIEVLQFSAASHFFQLSIGSIQLLKTQSVQQCFHDLSFTHAFNSERTIIFRCSVNSICHHAKLQTRHFLCNHFFVDIKIVIFYLHKASSSYFHEVLVSYIVTTHLFTLTSKCLDLDSFSLT